MKHRTSLRWEQSKRHNHEAILKALRDGDKRFKDLKKLVNFSEPTLASALEQLREQGLIQDTMVGRRVGYTLTKKGEKAYDRIFLLSDILSEIKSRGGKYLSGGTPFQKVGTTPLFWPASVHLAVDKNIDNISQMISKVDLFELQHKVVSTFVNNIRKKNIELDDKQQGNIVVGFEIEYPDLARMVNSNSLEKWKKMWRKEKEILTIWLQDSISGEKKPYILPFKILGSEKRK